MAVREDDELGEGEGGIEVVLDEGCEGPVCVGIVAGGGCSDACIGDD